MKKSSHWITASSTVAAALLLLILQTAGFAQSFPIRPTCSPNGACKVKTETFGFNDTNWRQWPLQERTEQVDPKAIGRTVIPTPPPIPEQQLPRAGGLPNKPPLSEGNPGESILPMPGISVTPDSSKINGGTTTGPNNANSGTAAPQNPLAPGPQGLPGISPEGLDLVPPATSPAPKNDSRGIEPLIPPKDSLLPGGIVPEALTPTPAAPATQSPMKSPDPDAPSPILPLDQAPSPSPKAVGPSPAKPIKGSSLSRRRSDAIAARTTTIQDNLPIQANWNASLEPEAVGDTHLRSTGFQQPTPETGNPLRCALTGYCPVELCESDRWVAGNPDFQTSYQGQVFHFSSKTAQKRFEASPEKYAPAYHGNDVVLAVEENRAEPGSVNHSAVWQGRLYLFSNSASLATFREDPARYTRSLRKAPSQIREDSVGTGN